MTTLPHFSRLRRRLAALSDSAAVVVLWGWPGTARRAFVRWLAERGEARPISASEAGMEPAPVGDEPRWWVTEGVALDAVDELRGRLRPSQTLVIGTSRLEMPSRLTAAVIEPRRWLLTEAEARRLLEQSADDRLEQERVGEAWSLTEGWYRPLVALAGADSPEERRQEVRMFLRTELLPLLSEPCRRVLEARPGADAILDPGTVEPGGDLWRELVEVLGLARPGPTGLTLPRVLRWGLAGTSAAPAPGAQVAAPRPAAFRLQLLGPPALQRLAPDGPTALRWPIRRSLLLLAFLASRSGLAAGREEVVEALWPEGREDEIERNLHPTVSLLRRTLRIPGRRPVVQYAKGVYRLDPEIDWRIDLLEFERAALLGRGDDERPPGSSELAAWEEGWRLYRGPFLPGYHEPWVVERREELERVYLELLRRLGEGYLQQERFSDAEDALRSALHVDPLQEPVYVTIMEIYARLGRRDLVRRQYEKLVELLRRELGMEPMPTTVTEYHRLMS